MNADPYAVPSWVTDPEQIQRAEIIRRLAGGEQIDGWGWNPQETTLHGESQYEHTTPDTATYQGRLYGRGGFELKDNFSLKDVAKLAAIMGGAYLGGTALAGAGGGGAGAAGASAGTAGAGSGAGLGITSGGLTPAAIEAGLGTAGYGANAGAAASGLFNPASIGAGAGLTFGPGAAAAGGAGTSLLNTLGSAGGMLKTALPVVGGLLGSQKAPDQTESRASRMDPRMEALVYGSGPGDTNSYLGAAQDWFKNNRSGLNDTMRLALQRQVQSSTNPDFLNNLNTARQSAMGLLSMPVAGNPFTRRG